MIVSIASSNEDAATVEPQALTFNQLNWTSAQTVTITAPQNAVSSGDQTSVISHSVTGVRDPDGIESVTVTDDDPGIAFDKARVPVLMDNERSATYEVSLRQWPPHSTSSVTMTITSSDTDVVTVSPASVTFTTQNKTRQTVTVTGKIGAAIDSTATITHSTSNALGAPGYDGLSASIGVRLHEPGIAVSRPSMRVLEGGSTTYRVALTGPPGYTSARVQIDEGAASPMRVRLRKPPPGAIVVDIKVPDDVRNYGVNNCQPNAPGCRTSVFSVTPARLTFTRSQWYVPQEVTISAAEDDNAHDEVIDLELVSTGWGGAVIGAGTVTDKRIVSTRENDTDSVTISVSTLDVPTNGSADYTISVTAEPIRNIRIEPCSESATLSFTPAYVTFGPENWDQPVRVTVTNAQTEDADVDDAAATVRHRLADHNGNSFNPEPALLPHIDVTILDGTPRLVFDPASSMRVGEGVDADGNPAASTKSYKVKLAAQPASGTTVTVTPSVTHTDTISASRLPPCPANIPA